MIEGYPRMKEIIEQDVASGLIDLPSSALDFQEPAGAAVSGQVRLDRCVRGSDGLPAVDRVKGVKALRDSVGSEFGGRHELYERNYSGNHENVATECANVSPACPRPAARSTSATRVAAVVDGVGQRATQSSQIDARGPPESAAA